MDPNIRSRFAPDHLAGIAGQVGIPVAELDELKGFENFVYSFDQDGEGRILRVGHDARRPERQVYAERAWLRFLHAGGAPVAAPLRLGSGEDLARVEDGVDGAYIGAVFERARGIRPEKENRDSRFYRAYGRSIGQVHALSRQFEAATDFGRPAWDSDDELPDRKILPDIDPEVAQRSDQILDRIRSLPSDESRFGMIHQDPHMGNLLVEDGDRITLFDFDDCCFGHFAYDIAMAFFYATTFDPDPAAEVREFFDDFASGYLQEHTLPLDCFDSIPLFMKLREIDLFSVIHNRFDVEKSPGEWASQFLSGRRERIVDETPCIEFDFGEAVRQLDP